MEELLQQAIDGKVNPTLEVLEFEDVPEIFARLMDNSITGRIVVKIPQ